MSDSSLQGAYAVYELDRPTRRINITTFPSSPDSAEPDLSATYSYVSLTGEEALGHVWSPVLTELEYRVPQSVRRTFGGQALLALYRDKSLAAPTLWQGKGYAPTDLFNSHFKRLEDQSLPLIRDCFTASVYEASQRLLDPRAIKLQPTH